MVLPLLLAGLIGGGAYLAGRFGGGGGSIDALSRNEVPVNLFGRQTIDKSTFSPVTLTEVQKTYSPQISIISGSPNSSLNARQNTSPSQTQTATPVTAGAGGQIFPVSSGSGGAGIDLFSIMLIGGLGLVAYSFFSDDKK